MKLKLLQGQLTMSRINISLTFSKSKNEADSLQKCLLRFPLENCKGLPIVTNILSSKVCIEKQAVRPIDFSEEKENRLLDTKIFFEYREFTSIIYNCCVTIKKYLLRNSIQHRKKLRIFHIALLKRGSKMRFFYITTPYTCRQVCFLRLRKPLKKVPGLTCKGNI